MQQKKITAQGMRTLIKASEEANAKYNEMLYYGLTDDPVDV